VADGKIIAALLEGLVRPDARDETKIHPGMAERWHHNADATEWTFFLREAQWSDGQLVTAHDFAYAYKTFKIGTNLTLFSDYLNNPENIKVYWDLDASLALNRFFTLTLRTNLIYDDVIKITDPKTGVAAPRVQFKEIVGLGFTYTFGQYVKAS
jgi:ABC-type transport system substrate-binding protein